MKNNVDPYKERGMITGTDSPFDAFIGRNAKDGYFWYQSAEGSVKLMGFEGIVVDGALFRVTGKKHGKPIEVKSNLCSPIQTELDIYRYTKLSESSEHANKEHVGTGTWKELQNNAAPGKYTKVLAVKLTKVVLLDGTEKEIDKLAEVRIVSTQLSFFSKYLQSIGIRDRELHKTFIKSGEQFEHESSAGGTFLYSKFEVKDVPGDLLEKYNDQIEEHFNDILHYVKESAPGQTTPDNEEKPVTTTDPYDKEHPMATTPIDDFPTAENEPPSTGKDDDLPF
jgi:hypothetical protein